MPKRRGDRRYVHLYVRLSRQSGRAGHLFQDDGREAVRSGGDLTNIGGDGEYSKTVVCPDGCVMFRLTAKKLGNENFFKGKFYEPL